MDNTDTDDFANLIDEFADLQDVDWDRLLGAPAADASHPPPARLTVTSPTTSSNYFEDFSLDTSLLAELDLLEQSQAAPLGVHSNVLTHPLPDVVPQVPAPSPSAVLAASISQSAGTVATGVGLPPRRSPPPVRLHTPTKSKCPPKTCRPLKRPRSKSISPTSKRKEANGFIFGAYEEDLTCPICCDIFAVAHASNPCGHSFCGDCSWGWVVGKKSDRCPICRTKLSKPNPMIPNVVVDKLVEKHIQLMGSQDENWAPTGHSHKEWRTRIDHWRSRAPERAKALKLPVRKRRVGVYVSDDEYVLNMVDTLDDDGG